MPSLDMASIKVMTEKERGPCAVCTQPLGVNYCRQCDEFFEYGHSPNCAIGQGGHQHVNHRTYFWLWTIYDHPLDYPDGYIARRHEVHPGKSWPTTDIIVGDLGTIRDALCHKGLIPLARDPADEPQILESWA